MANGLAGIMNNLRHRVFWPPFLLLFVACLLSLTSPDLFLRTVTAMNNWCLKHLGWAFSLQAALAVVCCGALFLSPLGKAKIGGDEAKPFLTRWNWFSITLCTTVAVGILFWSAAEPLYHFQTLPKTLAAQPQSAQAALWSQSIMFLHWSIVPYAFYSIPTVMFALAYYNRKHPFSLRSILFPFRSLDRDSVGTVVDGLCLYALVLGMASSLGTGLLTLVGGINDIWGTVTNPFTLGIVCILIVFAFCVSASTGLMKGIRILSDVNAKIFFAMAIFVLIFGSTLFIIEIGLEAMGVFLSNFFKLALYTGGSHGDAWPKSWSIFYWANWLAWAPITALFLGKLAYGYTVRECLLFTWLIPSLFACVWTTIFSGQVLSMQLSGTQDMVKTLGTKGPESIVFEMFSSLPLGNIVIVGFLMTAFLSYVTAADSNTEALGQISQSTTLATAESPDWRLKVVWGATIGVVAWVMVSFSGIDGIKMLSNLGGVVTLFLIFASSVGLMLLIIDKRSRADLSPHE